MHFILKLQKSLYPAFNLAHGTETKAKNKTEKGLAKKKRSWQQSVKAVREGW